MPSADLRYRGQSFEIEVPLEPAWLASGDVAAITEAFHAEHERIYGHADRDAPVQAISLRVVIAGAVPAPHFPEQARETGVPVALGEVAVHFAGACAARTTLPSRRIAPRAPRQRPLHRGAGGHHLLHPAGFRGRGGPLRQPALWPAA